MLPFKKSMRTLINDFMLVRLTAINRVPNVHALNLMVLVFVGMGALYSSSLNKISLFNKKIIIIK